MHPHLKGHRNDSCGGDTDEYNAPTVAVAKHQIDRDHQDRHRNGENQFLQNIQHQSWDAGDFRRQTHDPAKNEQGKQVDDCEHNIANEGNQPFGYNIVVLIGMGCYDARRKSP